jgi:hypothetical protein
MNKRKAKRGHPLRRYLFDIVKMNPNIDAVTLCVEARKRCQIELTLKTAAAELAHALKRWDAMAVIPRISKNADRNWHNNAIQFPRLLAELDALGLITKANETALCASMDIAPVEVQEIIDRATCVWDEIKARTADSSRLTNASL